MDNDLSLADDIFDKIDALAELSESNDYLTRRSLTKEHRRANELVGSWMRKAGMRVHTDAAGNIIGRIEGLVSGIETTDQPAMLIGSHLDTVRNGGRYDGMLGVVLPVVCLQYLQDNQIRLPYPVELVGFCDEEGVRFPSTLIGSRAIAGTLKRDVLNERLSNAILNRARYLNRKTCPSG